MSDHTEPTPTTDPSVAEIGEFTNHDPEGTPAASYRRYEDWRQRCPVVHSSAFDGFYILNRYADVRRAARNWEGLSSAQGVFQPPVPIRVRVIEADPPEHTRDRELLKEILNVDTYRTFERHVREDAAKLIDDLRERGRADLVAEICEPLPVLTICEVIGLDEEEARRVRPVAMRLFEAAGDFSLFPEAEADFNRLVADFTSSRREEPRDDYITRLAVEPLDGKVQSDAEIANLLEGFLIAGHHTTTSAMTSLFRHILEDPGIRDQLVAEPALIRAAVEETLRLNTPLHMFGRTAACPVQIDDAEIPEGSFVMLNWASANRDPKQFDDPRRFRLDRSPNPHMAFGHGIHTCVGAQLARLELEIVTAELLARIPDIEADGPLPDYRFSGGNLVVLPQLNARFAPSTPGS